MGLVVIEGLIIVLLVFTGFRTAVFRAVPPALKSAIAVGIGVFICLIGLVDVGFVRRLPDAAHTTVPVGLGIGGSIASWPTLVFVVGVLFTGILVAKKVRGAILIGVLTSTVLAIAVEAIVKVGPSKGVDPKGWNLGYPALPDKVVGVPNLSLIGDVSFGAWSSCADHRHALGVHAGPGRLLRRDGHDDRARQGSGPHRHGRPAAERRQGAVRRGARGCSRRVRLGELEHGVRRIGGRLPAFLTIVVMPFTYSIADGIGAGFISYVVIRAATGKAKQVHPLMWVIAVAFIAYFAVGPIQAALK
jgi:AGZA family xanthine/uracil permease-like MFS transporter